MITAEKRRKKRKKTRNWLGIINEKPHFTIILGKKGSGKTQLALKLLLDPNGYCGRYSKIWFFSPTFRAQFESVWCVLDKKGIVVYEKVTAALLKRVIDEQEADDTGKQVLCVFDDNGEHLRHIDPEVVNTFVSNSRHYRISSVFLSQKMTQLPTIIRENADVYISFAALSYIGVQALWKEVALVEKKRFMEVFREATAKQYSFLCISSTGGQTSLYKNCSEVVAL